MEFSLTGCASCGNDHDSLPFQDDPNGVPSARFVVCPKTGQRVFVIETSDVGAVPCTIADIERAAGFPAARPSSQMPGERKEEPVPSIADQLAAARENVASTERLADCTIAQLLEELRVLCALRGLLPLSKLDGIVELVVPAKPRKKRKETASRPALNRGLPKGEKAPRP